MNNKYFDKIAGYKEEKAEIIELSNLINNYEKLKENGGCLPSGLLISGPRGVGKSLFAESLIESCKCRTIRINPIDLDYRSDFEKYLNNKFEETTIVLPCIVYIDEAEKIFGNIEDFSMENNYQKSLYLLSLMNKYAKVEGIFYLFTANDDLDMDMSIVRNGRIDKKLILDLPNEEERQEIIEYYTKDKGIIREIDKNELSKLSYNFTPSDIKTWINNSICKAISRGLNEVTHDIFIDCFNAMVFRRCGKEVKYDQKSANVLAYHEAGHAVLNYLLLGNTLNRVTIISHGKTRGYAGYTKNEKSIDLEEDVISKICCDLGGYAVETMYFKSPSIGSANDLYEAKKKVCGYIRYSGGFGLKYVLPADPNIESYRFSRQSLCSQANLERIENEENNLIEMCFKTANCLLDKYSIFVESVANQLLKKKTITSKDIDIIFNALKLEMFEGRITDLALSFCEN